MPGEFDRGIDFIAAGVRADHDGPLVFDQPFRPFEVNARGVVLGELFVVGAILAPVTRGPGANQHDVSRLQGHAFPGEGVLKLLR